VTLRIERIEGRIRLSGEFRPEHLDQVRPKSTGPDHQSFWI